MQKISINWYAYWCTNKYAGRYFFTIFTGILDNHEYLLNFLKLSEVTRFSRSDKRLSRSRSVAVPIPKITNPEDTFSIMDLPSKVLHNPWNFSVIRYRYTNFSLNSNWLKTVTYDISAIILIY